MGKKLIQCPAPEVLTQAASEGVSPLLQKHLKGCSSCRQQLDEERESMSWLSGLAAKSPTSAEHQDARAALLAAAKGAQVAAPSAPRWPKIAIAAAAAILFSVGVSYWLSPAVTPTAEPSTAPVIATKGTVFAGNQAKFEHQTIAGNETVRLTEGSITIDVPKLKAGERFRVIVGDAEIEVRGTSFEVVAHNDKLVSVKVLQGEVEIKTAQEQKLVRLEPGERWVSAEQIAASETIIQEPSSLPDVVVVELPASAPTIAATEEKPLPKKTPEPPAAPDNSDETFREAFAAMRAGDLSAAISGFSEASKSSDPDTAADASFWYAISLQRSKSPEAKAALESFLQRFPSSPRVYEARLVLGRILLDNGSLEEAKHQLEEVAQRGPAALQKKAQDAIDAIQKRSSSAASQPTQ